ncbi:class I SAM-dependent methyltransferase [Roseovarius tibetensis]|uniref:class I SAM-dependent methyltransferase n=1 Tax=Roseovarius tibetensis TaxID=2685897 RepID=UPI003D7F3A74
MAEAMDTGARIMAILDEIGARDVLDIGCGSGALSRVLVGAGYRVTGLDPDADAIAIARDSVPEASFQTAGAEALPFDSATFDACVFLNALHHVPVARMQTALREGLRVLRPSGEVIVVEPLAEGPFFEVMRPVEDETEIRHAAIDAINAILDAGAAAGPVPVTYPRPTPMADTDAFIDRLARIDPARRAVAEAQRDRIERLFAQHATDGPGGRGLVQPLRLWRLRPA